MSALEVVQPYPDAYGLDFDRAPGCSFREEDWLSGSIRVQTHISGTVVDRGSEAVSMILPLLG